MTKFFGFLKFFSFLGAVCAPHNRIQNLAYGLILIVIVRILRYIPLIRYIDIRVAINIIDWDHKFKSNVVDNWKRDTFAKKHFAKAHRVDSMKLTIIGIISRCLLCLIKMRRRIKNFRKINILWTKKYLLVLKKGHNIKNKL